MFAVAGSVALMLLAASPPPESPLADREEPGRFSISIQRTAPGDAARMAISVPERFPVSEEAVERARELTDDPFILAGLNTDSLLAFVRRSERLREPGGSGNLGAAFNTTRLAYRATAVLQPRVLLDGRARHDVWVVHLQLAWNASTGEGNCDHDAQMWRIVHVSKRMRVLKIEGDGDAEAYVTCP